MAVAGLTASTTLSVPALGASTTAVVPNVKAVAWTDVGKRISQIRNWRLLSEKALFIAAQIWVVLHLAIKQKMANPAKGFSMKNGMIFHIFIEWF